MIDEKIESEQVSSDKNQEMAKTKAFHPESLTPRSVFFLSHLTTSLVKKRVLFHFLSYPRTPNTKLSIDGSSPQLLRIEAGREYKFYAIGDVFVSAKFRPLACSPKQTSELLAAGLVIVQWCSLLRKTDLI